LASCNPRETVRILVERILYLTAKSEAKQITTFAKRDIEIE